MSYIHWLRNLVGQRKIMLCYASVILQDDSGRVLLQRRTDFDTWGLPGGVMELDETIAACARRELEEETGLCAGSLRLTGVYSEPRYDVTYPNGDQVHQFTVTYAGRVAGGEMRVDGTENSDQRFFDLADIPWAGLSIFYRHMLLDALSSKPPSVPAPFTRSPIENQIEVVRACTGPATIIGVGATAVTLQSDGCALVVRRADSQDWTYPAGYLHIGENFAHTARRETLEETGIETLPERLMGVYSPLEPWRYPNGDRVQSVTAVVLSRPQGGLLQPDGDEITHTDWIAPAELVRRGAHPILDGLHRAVLAHLTNGEIFCA
jgi:ADP-ribose pyrophosphatase YjhB (NUDIX family)